MFKCWKKKFSSSVLFSILRFSSVLFSILQYSSVFFSILQYSSVFFSICLCLRFSPLLDSSLVLCRIRTSKIGRDISTLSWCLAGPSHRFWWWAISSWANVVGCIWSQPWSHAFIKRYETRMSSRSSDIIRSKCRKIDENHVLLEWDFFPLQASDFKEFFTKIPVPLTIRFHSDKKKSIKNISTFNLTHNNTLEKKIKKFVITGEGSMDFRGTNFRSSLQKKTLRSLIKSVRGWLSLDYYQGCSNYY